MKSSEISDMDETQQLSSCCDGVAYGAAAAQHKQRQRQSNDRPRKAAAQQRRPWGIPPASSPPALLSVRRRPQSAGARHAPSPSSPVRSEQPQKPSPPPRPQSARLKQELRALASGLASSGADAWPLRCLQAKSAAAPLPAAEEAAAAADDGGPPSALATLLWRDVDALTEREVKLTYAEARAAAAAAAAAAASAPASNGLGSLPADAQQPTTRHARPPPLLVEQEPLESPGASAAASPLGLRGAAASTKSRARTERALSAASDSDDDDDAPTAREARLGTAAAAAVRDLQQTAMATRGQRGLYESALSRLRGSAAAVVPRSDGGALHATPSVLRPSERVNIFNSSSSDGSSKSSSRESSTSDGISSESDVEEPATMPDVSSSSALPVTPRGGTLLMPNKGLRPEGVSRVIAALDTAPRLKRLVLAGNLLSDASLAELARALLARNAAAAVAGGSSGSGSGGVVAVRELDLSGNAGLTWRCARSIAALIDPQAVPVTAAARRAAGAATPAAKAPAQVRPRCVRRVRLEGVALGDKGAAVLAEALARGSRAKALLLARCGIRDAGAAALCAALPAAPRLRELDLSWNALGPRAAVALERALLVGGPTQQPETRLGRPPRPLPLRVLRLRNAGLSDVDAATVIDALARGAMRWRLVDLGANLLEGGAALCAAAAVAAAEAHDAAAKTTAASRHRDDDSDDSSSSSSSGSDADDDAGSDCGRAWLPDGVVARRALVLDGNPVGESGAACVMRALAGRHVVADVEAAAREGAAAAVGGAAGAGAAAPPVALLRTFPMCSLASNWHDDDGGSGDTAAAAGNNVEASSPLSLHVSVYGCSIVAGGKGFRTGVGDGAAGAATVPPAGTLASAVGPAQAAAAAPQPVTAADSKAAKAPASAAAAALGSASAAPAATAAAPLTAAVITERCSGLDLARPAGRYSLDLAHPATERIVAALLDLRARLAAFGAQQEAAADAAEAAVNDAAAAVQRAREAAAAAGALTAAAAGRRPRRSTTHDYVVAAVRRASQSGDAAAAAAAAASRRASMTTTAGEPAPVPPPLPAPLPPAKSLVRRFRAPPVDSALALLDVRLDGGRPVKPTALWELAPWAAARAARRSAVSGGTAAGQEGDGGAAAAPAEAPGAKAQPAKRRVYRRLTFTVMAAAIVSGEESAPLPARLLSWAVRVTSQPGTDDDFRLRVFSLLANDWLLPPRAVSALLAPFDPDLAGAQRLAAAQAAYARLPQPLDFWGRVAPGALKAPVARELAADASPWLTAFDRSNLTGRYALNLGRPLDRAAAARLQLAALQEAAWRDNRYFVAWRNATLDGAPLRPDALRALQQYAIPSSGALRLDFVSYAVPPPNAAPAPEAALRTLLARLRAARAAYARRVLEVRAELRPFGRRRAAGGVEVGDGSGGSGGSVDQPWWEGAGLDRAAVLGLAAALASDVDVPAAAAGGGGGSRPASAAAGAARPPSAAAGATLMRPSSSAAASRPPSAPARGVVKSASRRPASAAAAATATAPPLAEADEQQEDAARRSARTCRDAARLLRASSAAAVAAACAALGDARAAAALELLLLPPAPSATPAAGEAATTVAPGSGIAAAAAAALSTTGPAAAAGLVSALSPIVAARLALLPPAASFAWEGGAAAAAAAEADAAAADGGGGGGPLKPLARAELARRLPPAVMDNLRAAAAADAAAAAARAAAVLAALRAFARDHSAIAAAQLVRVLRALGPRAAEDRCAAATTLWARVADRGAGGGLVRAFQALSGGEQLSVMARLGAYHVWSTLARPEGLHFRLDLSVPEQRDVARDVVRAAVRASLAERTRTGRRVRQLGGLTADGRAVHDPEDEKLWLSLESKHKLLEFDCARTWDQELERMEAAVVRIQRTWRARHAAAIAAAEAAAAAAAAAIAAEAEAAAAAEAEAAARAAEAEAAAAAAAAAEARSCSDSCSCCSSASGGGSDDEDGWDGGAWGGSPWGGFGDGVEEDEGG